MVEKCWSAMPICPRLSAQAMRFSLKFKFLAFVFSASSVIKMM